MPPDPQSPINVLTHSVMLYGVTLETYRMSVKRTWKWVNIHRSVAVTTTDLFSSFTITTNSAQRVAVAFHMRVIQNKP